MPPPGVCMNIFNTRNRKDGYGTIAKPERFLNQDFKQLKEYCLTNKVSFLDATFPPEINSIGQGVLDSNELAKVEWLRPGKLVYNPSFVVDGISRFDFGQGAAKNCWFLASIGSLTFQNSIFQQVVPPDQNFAQDYCGLFHFRKSPKCYLYNDTKGIQIHLMDAEKQEIGLRFWRFGKWVDVVIDDKLPTINGRQLFVHCNDPTEFWPALMEKAYAKVCGSYANMNSGTPTEAMRDFTGGVHMYIQLSDAPPDLWELMYRAGKSRSLMGCGTKQGGTSENIVLPNGLVQGHAYAVTGVKQVISQGQVVSLVRLWNPWGKTEWKGDWSDNSALWQTVSPQDRDMCLQIDDNGEFWMSMDDFCKSYYSLDICSTYPDFLDGNSSGQWKTSLCDGRWVAGTTAGGCMNHITTFWTNPQYRIKISKLLNDKSEKNILVSLMQIPDKRNRCLDQNLDIGFYVFEVTEEYKLERGKFPASFFKNPVAHSKKYMNAREVMEVFTLKPGEYVIVPTTYTPNETASFILTIHSKEETNIYENSGGQNYQPVEIEEPTTPQYELDDGNKSIFFRQHCDKYEEVDAEQLQRLLNEKILKGDLKSGGFSIDACRSMVALMDTSITGRLNGGEFVRLWKKVVKYKDIFFYSDISYTGTLSLTELRNAIRTSGLRISDDMLNLMAIRYGASSGHITLESFISLILRFECMHKIFSHLSNGSILNLQESEWMYISMYT